MSTEIEQIEYLSLELTRLQGKLAAEPKASRRAAYAADIEATEANLLWWGCATARSTVSFTAFRALSAQLDQLEVRIQKLCVKSRRLWEKSYRA
jgi:hypothetical protein